jgi:hypothetical protein
MRISWRRKSSESKCLREAVLKVLISSSHFVQSSVVIEEDEMSIKNRDSSLSF